MVLRCGVNGVGTDAGTRSLTSSPWPSKVAESLKSGIHKTLREERVKKEESEEEIFQGYHCGINDQSSSPGCCCPLVVPGDRPAAASIGNITWAVTPSGEPARTRRGLIKCKGTEILIGSSSPMDLCYMLKCPGGPQMAHLAYWQILNLVGSYLLLQLKASKAGSITGLREQTMP